MYPPSYSCVLCSEDIEETLVRLFHHCHFAKACWQMIQVHVPNNLHPYQTLESFKGQLNVPFFMEIIVLMSWSIWIARNDLIFRNYAPLVESARCLFKREFSWAALRAPANKSLQLVQWIESLL
jgi:hypothetical protein